MDTAVIDRKTLTVVDAEDVHSLTLAFARSVMVYITAADEHVQALTSIHRFIAAFIDVRVHDRESSAVLSLDSECAASIETAGVNVDICTVFQRQNSA
jgi:hypothetical protein